MTGAEKQPFGWQPNVNQPKFALRENVSDRKDEGWLPGLDSN